ncbi:ubiquitin carboxyl-terminal hydrolase 10-like isoform X2 [Daphnia carinata]|uniref:ubiquitin carboxyl-terminal hydrolase 10-like isoform X2 n=1 Tax=Daphnia carinata TaxID=120202 RepID=UPI00257F2160|nr:ubiquitin carboxyl-terminal hydrolase 10-like isoform X2 [Daphnia carinata]
MEDTLQELEFLDFSDLPENEVQNLKSFIIGPTKQDEQKDNLSSVSEQHPCEGCVGSGNYPDMESAEHVPVVFSAPNPVHSMYQQNVCITSIPQYQPIMSYPMQIMPGGHLVASSPNYYVGNIHSPPIPHPASFSPPHRILNSQLLTYPKRKNVRVKYSPRKDIVNGHAGDVYSNMVYQPPVSYMGPCFTGDVVQAVTGVPIVMHQSVPSYVPPHGVQVTAANSPQLYPVVNYPPTETTLSLDFFVPAVNEATEEILAVNPTPVLAPLATVSQVEAVEEKKTKILTPSEVPASPVEAISLAEDKPLNADPSEAKSWASLFKKDAPVPVNSGEKPTARVGPFTPSGVVTPEMASVVSRPTVDVRTRRTAEHLASYELVMVPVALLPRGLINKSNWCYINATLQALIACAPFVHLVKSLERFTGGKKEESTTPIMDSVIDFVDQFEVIPVRTGKERASAKKEEPRFGTSFEPCSVYKMLSKIRSETFKVEGRQEDAEEFLSCLLNGLHDEMIDVVKASNLAGDKPPVQVGAKSDALDEEDWQIIGPKNRGCVTHTTTFSKTPVSNLFLGQMRSALYYAGAQSTATLQPFFSLQLDIQNEKVNSVRDALACLVSKEPLTGYVCPKTGQEVEASRQTTLEELPPILILHLKCFVYDKSGGCQKLLKRVDFSSDLELSKDFLSPNQKSKLKERQRQYKLFAVVYHDGKEATKGHYVTEVHHSGTGSWLRFDDSIVRVVDTQLFKYNLPRMPYLLLYRKLNV